MRKKSSIYIFYYTIVVQLHDTQFTHVPHSLLGVFLVNVLVHMHLLIGGVGIHWYFIRSKTGAGINCSRVLPAKYSICSSIDRYMENTVTVNLITRARHSKCPYFLALSFLFNFIAPITIPPTSSVARTPKTVPPTKPPMVAAVAEHSGVGSGWTNAIFCSITEWNRYYYSGRFVHGNAVIN